MKKRRFGLFAAWVAATAMATVLASQAVALVRDQVTDRPSRVATTLALETTTSTNDPPTTTDGLALPSSTTTTQVGTTSTASSATTSSTQPEETTTSTPATTPTTSTTSTTSTTTGANQEETFYVTGGWATVRCTGNDVALTTYAPNPGYKVEIKSAGPEKVVIKFEASGDDHESQLEVRCDSGVLKPGIDEHEDD